MDWNADVLYVSLYEAYLRYFLPLNGPERHGLDNELQSSSRPILSRQERLSRYDVAATCCCRQYLEPHFCPM